MGALQKQQAAREPTWRAVPRMLRPARSDQAALSASATASVILRFEATRCTSIQVFEFLDQAHHLERFFCRQLDSFCGIQINSRS